MAVLSREAHRRVYTSPSSRGAPPGSWSNEPLSERWRGVAAHNSRDEPSVSRVFQDLCCAARLVQKCGAPHFWTNGEQMEMCGGSFISCPRLRFWGSRCTLITNQGPRRSSHIRRPDAASVVSESSSPVFVVACFRPYSWELRDLAPQSGLLDRLHTRALLLHAPDSAPSAQTRHRHRCRVDESKTAGMRPSAKTRRPAAHSISAATGTILRIGMLIV